MKTRKPVTLEEFLQKFPDTKPKSNCLMGLACPKCGQRTSLRITSVVIATVFDNGTDRDESDCEWDSKSACRCNGAGTCGFEGTVADFTIQGLDIWDEEHPDRFADRRLTTTLPDENAS